MNETQRQFYLKQCGITLWYSHTPLPGAAPSPDYEFPLSREAQPAFTASVGPGWTGGRGISAEQYTPAPAARERIIPAEQKSTLHRVIAETVQSKKPAEIKPGKASSSVPATEPAVAVETGLALDLRIAVARDLVVIAQLDKDLSVEMQERLLLGIVGALGHPASMVSCQSLSWPVFSNRRVPGNDDKALVGLLKRVLKPLVPKAWIGLGAEVQGLVTLHGQALSGSSPEGVRLLFENDLGALSISGELKRKLWDLLRSSTTLAPRVEH